MMQQLSNATCKSSLWSHTQCELFGVPGGRRTSSAKAEKRLRSYAKQHSMVTWRAREVRLEADDGRRRERTEGESRSDKRRERQKQHSPVSLGGGGS